MSCSELETLMNISSYLLVRNLQFNRQVDVNRMEKNLGRNGLQIAVDILSYLSRNPEAKDTLEGIVDWWLLQQEIERKVVNVKKVLDELVREELILEIKSGDNNRHYRISAEKYDQIMKFIEANDNA